MRYFDTEDKYGRLSFMFESDTVIGRWEWKNGRVDVLSIMCREGKHENVELALQELVKECIVTRRKLFHKKKAIVLNEGYYHATVKDDGDAILRVKDGKYSLWYDLSNTLFRDMSDNLRKVVSKIGDKIK